MKKNLAFFFAGFFASMLIVVGTIYWYIVLPEKSAVLESVKVSVPPVRRVPFKVKILLPKEDRAPVPPTGWSFGLRGEIYAQERVYQIAKDVSLLPSGPPYQISGFFEGAAFAEALALPVDVFDIRLVVSLCRAPGSGCEKVGESSQTSSTWIRLSRAQLTNKDGVDFGARMVNYLMAANDRHVACGGSALSGTVEASAAMQPLLASTKQVLVLVPSGIKVISGPQESRVWKKELSFTGTTANFSASFQSGQDVSLGGYFAAVAFCDKGTPDLECAKSSGLWDSQLRSYPFGKRRYLQLVTKDFAAIACGAPAPTLVMHMLDPKYLGTSFDALPSSLPEEVRATPWAGSCSDCKLAH